jgi:hypothetical protein
LELRRLVSWIWGFQAKTGLTGELHRPDRCRGLSVEIVRSCPGVPDFTSLTGGGDRSDRCSLWLLELLVPLRSRVGFGGC